MRDIEVIERVQRHATKLLPAIRQVDYENRLQYLGIQSLKTRRIRSDLILVFKMFHDLIDLDIGKFFVRGYSLTRGHNFKIETTDIPRLELRRNFFTHRVVRLWNSLPGDVVNATSLSSFKQRLHASNCLPF